MPKKASTVTFSTKFFEGKTAAREGEQGAKKVGSEKAVKMLAINRKKC